MMCMAICRTSRCGPYVEIQEMFAPAYHGAKTDAERENVKRLAWFSTEFGLIRQDGELKIFGTGLISSKGEMEHVLGGNTPLLPFKAADNRRIRKGNMELQRTALCVRFSGGIES